MAAAMVVVVGIGSCVEILVFRPMVAFATSKGAIVDGGTVNRVVLGLSPQRPLFIRSGKKHAKFHQIQEL